MSVFEVLAVCYLSAPFGYIFFLEPALSVVNTAETRLFTIHILFHDTWAA